MKKVVIVILDIFLLYLFVSESIIQFVLKKGVYGPFDYMFLLFILLYLILRVYCYYTVFRIAFTEKDTVKRLSANICTAFEQDIIKKVCAPDFFPYYIFYSSNNNAWNCLYATIRPDESVFSSFTMDFVLDNHTRNDFNGPKTYRYCPSFITNKDRIIIIQLHGVGTYSDCELVMDFHISAIEKIEYKILPKRRSDDKYGIFTRATIYLNNGNIITSDSIYSRTIEIIKDIMWKNDYVNNLDPDEMSMSYTKRQLKKVEELYENRKINVKTYEDLRKKAGLTLEEVNKTLVERRLKGGYFS